MTRMTFVATCAGAHAGAYIAGYVLAWLMPTRGTIGSGGLGGLAAIGPMIIAVGLPTVLAPFAVGLTAFRRTGKKRFVLFGLSSALLSPIIVVLLVSPIGGAALPLYFSLFPPAIFSVAIVRHGLRLLRSEDSGRK